MKGLKRLRNEIKPLTVAEIGTLKRPLDKYERKTMAKHKALEGAKSKMFREVTKKRSETSPSYKEASRMSKIHQEQWKKKGL